MSKKIIQWLMWLGLMWLGLPASAAQEIQLLTHYTSPPYAVEGVAPADSYTVRLAQWLSQQSAGRYHFVPRQVPKKRLLYTMAQPDWLGVAAWINPLWVEDAQRQRYLWSAVVQHETDFLVSRKADKVELVQGAVNRAARFGGLNGYFYPGLEAGFKSGLLSREDAQNHLSNVRKLQRSRIDVIILPASVLASVRMQVPDFDQWAYIAPEPQAAYALSLAGNRNNPELMTFINQLLPKLAQDPAWAQTLQPGAPVCGAQEIQLLTEYTALPFAVNGVSAADSYTVRLAQWLSAESGGCFRFVPRQVPRPRLVQMLEQPDWRGVVAWVNPEWFADRERQRYLWSSVLMRDVVLRVSRRADKVVFAQGHPLKVARFGGIIGYQYPSLEADFKSGLLIRDDAYNQLSNVLKLQIKHVDVILLQASLLPYLRTQVPDFDQWAYVDPQPQATLERSLFTSRNDPELMAFINQALPKLMQDPAWVAALRPGEQ